MTTTEFVPPTLPLEIAYGKLAELEASIATLKGLTAATPGAEHALCAFPRACLTAAGALEQARREVNYAIACLQNAEKLQEEGE